MRTCEWIAAAVATRRKWTYGPDLLIGMLALWLRVPRPEPLWSHVDERAFVLYPLGFLGGNLNPYFFNYPTLQLYLAAAADFLYWWAFSPRSLQQFIAYHYFVDPQVPLLVARWLTSGMAVVTVVLTMRLAAALYGRRAGWAAGMLLAVLPLHVRFAHLATTDVPAAMWITAAVWAAVSGQRRGKAAAFLCAGVCTGLAAATKYPAALSALPVAVAALHSGRHRWRLLAGSGLAALITFALATPFVWHDAVSAWTALAQMANEHLWQEDHAVSGNPLSHLIHATLRHGVGGAALLTGLVSLAWCPRSTTPGERVVATAVLAFAGFCLLASSGFMRYAVPLAPLLAVLCMRLPFRLARRPVVTALWMAALLWEPMLASLQTRRLLGAPDTRIAASAWIAARGESGVRLIEMGVRPGRLQVLSPAGTYVREGAFVRSFGVDRLTAAYRQLATEPNLPTLYVRVPLPAAARHATSAAPATTAVLALQRHPLCPPSPWESMLQNLPGLSWVASFSPGDLQRAVFDRVDWFFVPVAGFAAVEGSGPQIAIGHLSLSMTQPVPSAGQFFSLLYHLQAAATAVEARRWALADSHFQQALGVPFVADEVLSITRKYELFFGLGAVRHHQGNLAGAVEAWETAAATAPTRLPVWLNLGAAYLALGRAEAAAGCYMQVVKLEPDQADALYGLGAALARQGQGDRSRAILRRALEVAPSHRQAAAARQAMAGDL